MKRGWREEVGCVRRQGTTSVENTAAKVLVLVVVPLLLFWSMNMWRGERVILCGPFRFRFLFVSLSPPLPLFHLTLPSLPLHSYS